MPDLVFAVPGSLDTPTGGYVYDKRVIAEARAAGVDVAVLDLGEGFPKPADATRAAATAALASIPAGVPVVVDGLALGVLPGAASTLARTNPLIALVHHPLALETGLAPQEKTIFQASEQVALSFAKAVIVTSAPTADTLVADFGVARETITIAEPGTEPAKAFSIGSGDDVIQLVSVGAISKRKGYIALVTALAMIDEHKWRLTIVGDRTRDPEGYGMAMAEAVAHGLPVVGTAVGAVPSFVSKESGLLVEPGDIPGLANALRAIVTDHAMREGMAAMARDRAKTLPRWADTAAAIVAVARRST